MALMIRDRDLDSRIYTAPIPDDLQALIDSISLSFVDDALPTYYGRVTIRTTNGKVETFEHGHDGMDFPGVDREAWMSRCAGGDTSVNIGRFLGLVDNLETLRDASVLLDVLGGDRHGS